MSSLAADFRNLNLSEPKKISAEYIWIDVSGIDTRSKLRTLPKPVNNLSEVPNWSYDSSRIGQAHEEDGEVILCPQAIFKDPIRGGRNILVMCDAYPTFGQPVSTNKRYAAAQIFSRPEVIAEKPWFGIEQEYTLLQKDVIWPIGLPVGKVLKGSCYCGVGTDKSFGRAIADSHYNACLNAGISISGFNQEVMPGQWAFQVGPTVGISAGDELWVARYILQRITEDFGVVLSFNPKPVEGIWEEAGAPMNYSTKSMRTNGGYEVIKKAIEKLGLRHIEHTAAYGFTERLKTAPFFWDVGNRSSGASIHVSRETEELGKGYFEDRRPASDMDPYVATSMIADTTILWKP